MGKYLVTGAAGSGKTTIAIELRNRGMRAYDLDEVAGEWQDIKSGKRVDSPVGFSVEYLQSNAWNWNDKRLAEALAAHDNVYLCGIGANQAKFYALFDKIFLLSIDESTLKERLTTRSTSDYGKDPAELAKILNGHAGFEASVRDFGALAIDATLRLDAVVDAIIQASSS